MIKAFQLFIINLLLLVTLAACNSDPLDVDVSDMTLEVELQRFDRELFMMDFDTVDDAVAKFYVAYGDFFDVFNVHVINIGAASQRYYNAYLSMFVNDPGNREVYDYTQEVFTEDVTAAIGEDLTEGFRRYMYHFPEDSVPGVIGYVSRFNHKLFTVEDQIGVGLDQYLGKDCAFYDMLGTPEYMQFNMYPEKIPSDVFHVWATAKFPYNDSVDNVLNRMIHGGLMYYFTDAMLPGTADSLKIGFSPGEMTFCRNNEAQMWTYLVEHKLLFSSDPLVIRKLIDEAPTTHYFPSESPGRAAVWMGWQIVREYARRNPGLSLAEIMTTTDYQAILRGSRYSP